MLSLEDAKTPPDFPPDVLAAAIGFDESNWPAEQDEVAANLEVNRSPRPE